MIKNKSELKNILINQSILDAILIEEEECYLRVNTFIKDNENNLEIARIDNGAGDNMFCIFSEHGVIIKGFDHESEISPYGDNEIPTEEFYKGMNKELLSILDDEMFVKEDVTFCIWQERDNEEWIQADIKLPDNCTSNEDGGKGFLLGYIHKDFEDWFDWAKDYYELGTNIIKYVEYVFNNEEITEEIVKGINPERDFESVIREIESYI